MKKLIVILLICLSGCTITPKDQAWITAKETPNPPGVNGNCLPAARVLQDMYGGEIAIVSHLNKPEVHHAVLMLEDDRFLDNGTLGYEGPWVEAAESGWRFIYWWKP